MYFISENKDHRPFYEKEDTPSASGMKITIVQVLHMQSILDSL